MIFSDKSLPIPESSSGDRSGSSTRPAIGSARVSIVRAPLRWARTRNGFAPWISSKSAKSTSTLATSTLLIDASHSAASLPRTTGNHAAGHFRPQ